MILQILVLFISLTINYTNPFLPIITNTTAEDNQNEPSSCRTPVVFDFKIENLEVAFSCEIPKQYHYVEWWFGDGMTSREQNPVHTYEKSGIYDFTLTACNTEEDCCYNFSGRIYAFDFD